MNSIENRDTRGTDRRAGFIAAMQAHGLDATRLIASPLELIRKSKFTHEAEHLFKLMAHRKVSALVIGLPVNMDGTEGPRAQSCRAFARNLDRIQPVNVAFWDERLSTSAVERFLIDELDRAELAREYPEMEADHAPTVDELRSRFDMVAGGML